MRLYFCTTQKPLSVLIRWIFKEPASHFAIEFDDTWVIHSSLTGAEIDYTQWFRSEHIVVSSLVPFKTLSLEEEEDYYQKALRKKPSKTWYDFPAFFYFGYRGLLFRLFQVPIPSKNPFNSSGLLCTEEAKEFGFVPDNGPDTSMTTPWQLKSYLLASGNFVEEIL